MLSKASVLKLVLQVYVRDYFDFLGGTSMFLHEKFIRIDISWKNLIYIFCLVLPIYVPRVVYIDIL